MTRSTTDTIDTLIAEIQDFCAKEGLPQDSADDLLIKHALTEPQRQWLTNFCQRWDALIQPANDCDGDDVLDTSDDL